MTDDDLEALGKQMRALSQSLKTDPVLKALTYLVWQQIDELGKNPGDTYLHKMMIRMCSAKFTTPSRNGDGLEASRPRRSERQPFAPLQKQRALTPHLHRTQSVGLRCSS